MNIIKIDRDLRTDSSEIMGIKWFDADESFCWNEAGLFSDGDAGIEFLYLTPKGNWILKSDRTADEDSDPEEYHDQVGTNIAAITLLPYIKAIVEVLHGGAEAVLGAFRRPGPLTEAQRKALQDIIDYTLPGEL